MDEEQGKGEPVEAMPQEPKASATEDRPQEPSQAGPKNAEGETDRQKWYKGFSDRRQYSFPNEVLIECLKESFTSDRDLRNLCLARFEELHGELKESDRRAEIIGRLVEHCVERSTEHVLWDYIRERRPLRYDEFYSRWEKARKSSSRPFGYYFGSESEQSARQRPSGPDGAGGGDHVLAREDKAAIARWFHEDLDPEERSMVLTVALFQGINRKHMASISEEIERRLFKNNS
jgi:hypothetical protein